MYVANNILSINERIKNAAKRAGRNKDDIMLVAVSKYQSIENIKDAKESGQYVFGENKAKELAEKYQIIKDVKWHFIGHLQKNKVKYIIDKVEMIHSLDSIELACEINKKAENLGLVMNLLIQINIGNEDTKSGIFESEIDLFIENLKQFKNIKVLGIMAIPPKTSNEDEARNYFKSMNRLFQRYKDYKHENIDFKYLSMGMTDDFEIAIEEGANIIRVGTGIFGDRI